jgi:manganese/zinc/iron transport system substrate-binding protein
MMLRYFIFVFFIIAVLGCNNTEKIKKDKIQILTTTTPVKDIAEYIAGDKADVQVLMTAGADPHLYKASENDLNKINNADIIMFNGLHLEGRLEEIFSKMSSKITTINISESLPHDDLLHAHHHHDGEHHNHAHDPHFWLDVNLYKIAAESFYKAIAEFDSINKNYYQTNFINFSDKLDELDALIRNKIDSVPIEKKYLITAHNAYNYFSRTYGIKSIGIQGVSTSHQAGASEISNLAEFITENKIPAVFFEKGISHKSVEALKEAVNSKISEDEYFDFTVETLQNPGSYEGNYIDMMKNNVEIISKALKND